MNIESDLLNKYKKYLIEKKNTTFKDILKIVPTTPQHFVVFPTIVFKEANNSDDITYSTLDRLEYVNTVLYQVDIYAKDVIVDNVKYPARDVISELKTLTADFFREIGFTKLNDTPNDTLSLEIKRRTMTFESKISCWNKTLK